MKQLGEILLDDGLVTEAQLLAALDETMARGTTLGRTLVELGVLTEGQLVKALANQVGMDVRRPRRLPGRPHRRQPGARRRCAAATSVLPVALEGGVDRARDVRPRQRHGRRRRALRRPGMPVIPVIATHDNLLRAIDRFCRADDEMEDLVPGVRGRRSPTPRPTCRRWARSATTTRRSCGSSTCWSRRRSPTAPRTSTSSRPSTTCGSATGSTACCTRCSGRPSRSRSGVISRVKIMSDIDIAERRKPQDGRMSVVHNGRKIDLRVATLPTVWGEKIVMRILDNSTASLDLRDLSFLDDNYETYHEVVHQAVRHDPGHRARPVRASRRRCTRRSTRCRSPRSTSSPSRTRSSTGCPASTRCR